MNFDVARARRETPGCQNVVHFNNAGASLPPQPVLDAMRQHLEREAAIGGYEAESENAPAIQNFYAAAARLLHCQPEEVAYCENATRAWDMAFYSIPFRPGDRILTGRSEYGSSAVAFLQVCQRTGATVDVLPDDAHGQISLAALHAALNSRVKLIALTHVPSNGGLVNPAAEVGKIARDAGILYLLDACQSAGQMPLDVEALGCDMLTGTGRKYLRGPRGTGFLYIRSGVAETLEPPFLDITSTVWTSPDTYEMLPAARRFQTYETNVAAKIGLGVAMDYALRWGLDAIEARVTALAATLRARLRDLPGVTIRDLGLRQCGIVTFTADHATPAEIKHRLGQQGIHVWVSQASSTPWDMAARNLTGVVRASLHYYNTEDEIDHFCAALAGSLNKRAGS